MRPIIWSMWLNFGFSKKIQFPWRHHYISAKFCYFFRICKKNVGSSGCEFSESVQLSNTALPGSHLQDSAIIKNCYTTTPATTTVFTQIMSFRSGTHPHRSSVSSAPHLMFPTVPMVGHILSPSRPYHIRFLSPHWPQHSTAVYINVQHSAHSHVTSMLSSHKF
jgi:hypothetical protein